MRPPAPLLSLEIGSPNACTLCHVDEMAEWADEHVRAWRTRDYQTPMLDAARLVAAAREADWSRLDDMLAFVTDVENDEVTRTTLVRLLAQNGGAKMVPVLLGALADASPLVRSAAAAGLEGWHDPRVIAALLDATGDPVRLVRIRAAGALSGLPPGDLPPALRDRLAKATGELEAALTVRPDAWSTYYNLGNLHAQRGEQEEALAAFRRAARLRPDVEAPWVNAAMLHAQRGELGLAENALRRAIEIAPKSGPANFNLGLLLAERGRPQEAKQRLRTALEADPRMAAAAYNLASLLAEEDAEEALALYRRAWEEAKDRPRYAYAYAWSLHGADRDPEALKVLTDAAGRGAVSGDVYGLLAELYRLKGDVGAARAVLQRALEDPRLSPQERATLRKLAESSR